MDPRTKLSLILTAFALAFLFPPLTHAATYTVLHSFVGIQDGELPNWTVTQDTAGNLFGTTFGGGQTQGGVVYELGYGTWSETIIHSFDFNNEGDGPAFGVALDEKGDLYGTTIVGGGSDQGTVFELTPSQGQWAVTVLYELGSRGLLLDGKGNLYSALGAGKYGEGAIGELSLGPDAWTYNDLYSFCAEPPQCQDGEAPNDPLVFDTSGKLYGTTLYGGNEIYCVADTYGCGVAFQLKPNRDGTWTYHLLHAFATDLSDGEVPTGALAIDGTGSLYGATNLGGPTGGGTVYRLIPSSVGQGWKEAILYTFADCLKGCSPVNGLAMDKSGNLYGAAGGGNTLCAGNNYCGLVYELSPEGGNKWKYTVLHKFSGTDGYGPLGVTVGSDGNLYGTTLRGGKDNLGVVFQITP